MRTFLLAKKKNWRQCWMVGDSTPCFRASSIFQQPFPSSTLAIAGGEKVEERTRASLLLLAGFSVVFSFAGKLDYYELAELVPQRRIFAREPRIFSPIHYLGNPSHYVSLPHSLLLLSSLSLSVSRVSKCCAQLLKQPIPTKSPSLPGVCRFAAGAASIILTEDTTSL